MQNIVEFLIIFDLCFVFTILGFLLEKVPWGLIFKFLAMTCWFIVGLFYAGLVDPVVPALGWIFYLVALSYLLVLFRDGFMMWEKRKWVD